MKWRYFLLLGFFLLYFGKIDNVMAHGTQIDYQLSQALQIKAIYDNGRPMKEAQVVVYAPNNPTEPWLTGKTDSAGQFTFIPDFSQQGNWDIKVRQAGHGKLISIPLSRENTSTVQFSTASPHLGYTPLQKAVMAVSGIWGFFGTAMYFSRNKAHL